VTKEVLALGLTVLVHVIGMGALVWALLLDEDERPDWRGWWRGGDDGDPHPPRPGPGDGRLPLEDAEPSAVRLRGPGRLAGGYAPPARRPRHDPARTPQPAPAPPD